MEIPKFKSTSCKQENNRMVVNPGGDSEGELELEVMLHDEKHGGVLQRPDAKAAPGEISEGSIWVDKGEEIAKGIERRCKNEPK